MTFERSHAHSLAISLPSLALALAGCFAHAAPQSFGAGATQRGPSHAPATASDWARSDAAAQQAISSAGIAEALPPVHLSARGPTVEHRMSLEAGYCYRFGLGWQYASEAMVSFGFEPTPDGRRVSRSFAVRTARLRAPSGSYSVCADDSGPVLVTVVSISPDGTMATDELLEYAMVVARTPEPPELADARRARETQEAAAVSAQMQANVEAARAREEEARARAAREQAMQANATSSGSSSSNGAASSGASGPRSVTVHSDCERTIGLYRGSGRPPYGSGTYGNISSNSTESFTLSAGETLWLVDDSRNPISSYAPSGGERVAVTRGCAGFARD